MVEEIVMNAKRVGKSPSTVQHILALVSQVWSLAVTRDIVSGASPTKRIKKPVQDNQRMRFLTPEEASKLLKVLKARSLDVYDTALLSLFSGLRAGEIHALTWGDINLEGGTIYIKDSKNKHSRYVYITPDIEPMLQRRYKGQSKVEFVFPSINGKQRRWISDTFSRVVQDIGLNNSGETTIDKNGNVIHFQIKDARQRVVFHSLRHIFASWLVQKGTSLYTVAELMGHSSLEMTKRYSNLAQDNMRLTAFGLYGILNRD